MTDNSIRPIRESDLQSLVGLFQSLHAPSHPSRHTESSSNEQVELDWDDQLEFHLEVHSGTDPFCAIYGNRMGGRIEIPPRKAAAMIHTVKHLAGLSTEAPPVPQSGTLKLDGRSYHVNCCPQPHGEILIFRPVR